MEKNSSTHALEIHARGAEAHEQQELEIVEPEEGSLFVSELENAPLTDLNFGF